MEKEEVLNILGHMIQPDHNLYDLRGYVSWDTEEYIINLDGEFTADELEAMAIWMRLYGTEKEEPEQLEFWPQRKGE